MKTSCISTLSIKVPPLSATIKTSAMSSHLHKCSLHSLEKTSPAKQPYNHHEIGKTNISLASMSEILSATWFDHF